MKKLLIGFLLFPSMLLSSCGITKPLQKSESKLSLLEVGQGKKDVFNLLGFPDRVRASRKLENGSVFELHEYKIYGPYKAIGNLVMCPLTIFISCFFPDGFVDPDLYWMQYVDGKIDRWGKAGDWQSNISADINIHQVDKH